MPVHAAVVEAPIGSWRHELIRFGTVRLLLVMRRARRRLLRCSCELRRIEVAVLRFRPGFVQSNVWEVEEEVEVETGVIVAETPQSVPGTLSITVPALWPFCEFSGSGSLQGGGTGSWAAAGAKARQG